MMNNTSNLKLLYWRALYTECTRHNDCP